MAKLSIVAGATSQSVNVKIYNSSSTAGAGLTGLVFNTAGLIAYYTFTGANATATVINLVTLAAVNSAYSSGGFKEIDATHMPGLYRLDLPNAVVASASGQEVTVMLSGASNMAECQLDIELTAWNNQDAVHGGLSALPNAAAGANGGLPIIGLNGGSISFTGLTSPIIATSLTINGTAMVSQTGDTYPVANNVSANLGGLTSAQLSGFATVQVNTNALSSSLAGLTSAQLSGFMSTETSLNSISSNLAGLTSAQLAGFASAQTSLNSISSNLAGLTSAQLNGFASAATTSSAILTQATLARQGAINRRETSPVSGVQTLYADDGTTPLKTGNIYLDVGGTQPYDGTGPINRQNGLS